MRNLILLAVLLILTQTVYASNESIDMSQTIDISGTYTPKKPLTASQKLKILRTKLEKKNEQMIKKKIETIRYKQELEMMAKLKAVFDKQLKELDNL